MEQKKHSLKLKPLEISSPPIFQCPISLEIMKSPVSLSSGVTYDRSSIQKWLDSGHRTCPATCQPLSTLDLVPNLTLRNLINQMNVSNETKTGIEVSDLLDETDFERSESIVVYLDSIHGEMRETTIVSKIVENLDDSVSVLVSVMKESDKIESRISACRLIESILVSKLSDQDSIILIIERFKLFDELVSLIRDTENQNAALAGIDCMLNVIESHDKRKLLVELAKSGATQTLIKIIKSNLSPADVAGKAMKLLEQSIQCKEGLSEILTNSKQIIEILSERMMRVGKEGREAAVGTIWGMCRKSEVRNEIKRINGLVERLLMVMQEDCEPVVGLMAGDLLRVCVGGRGGFDYTKTMHIMPF